MYQTGDILSICCSSQDSPWMGEKEPSLQAPAERVVGMNRDGTNRRTRHLEHEYEIPSEVELLEGG